MITRATIAFVLLGMAWPTTGKIHAEPSETSFKDMFEQSATIVVARHLEDRPGKGEEKAFRVEVLEVLKGTFKLGKHAITLPEEKRFNYPGKKAEEFVAFLDEDKVIQFMGTPVKGDKVSDGLLRLNGARGLFAHFVTPGMATLEQVKTYLAKGTLLYRFQGEIFFPQLGKPAWKASTIAVTGTYDAVMGKTEVTGLPKLSDFGEPHAYIAYWHDEGIEVAWRGEKKRTLALYGKLGAIDAKTGTMRVLFVLAQPLLLTQKAFEEFVADPLLAPPVYQFKLACAPAEGQALPKVLTLKIHESNEGFSSGEDRLTGYGDAPLPILQRSYSFEGGSMHEGQIPVNEPPKTIYEESIQRDNVLRVTAQTKTKDFLTLGFQIGGPALDENDTYWTLDNRLVYGVYRANGVQGTIRLHEPTGARTVGTFTATLEHSELQRKR